MNVLQIIKQARYEVDAIRTGGVVSQMWQTEEVLQAANTAMDATARLLRLSGSDILTRTMLSTDGAQKLIHEDYSPRSLQIQPDQTTYTLPENCIRIVSIRPITQGFEGVKFHPAGIQDTAYISLKNIPVDFLASANQGEADYYYTVTGARTLTFAPTPKDVFDIELIYHIRPAKMRYVQAGTIQRTNGLVSVSGSGTSWLTNGVRAPAELMVGLTDINTVVLDVSYPTLGDDILSDTTLTLARAATTTDSVGQVYTLAASPKLPEEHHAWLAQMTSAIMMRKVDIDLSTKLTAELAADLLNTVTPEITLRQLQESLITEAFSIPN